MIRATRNGGGTWRSQASGITSAYLAGVSCASAETCVAVGAGGLALTTADGGLSWQSHTAPVGGQTLVSVSCPTAATCYAAGIGGKIVKTTDAGQTWAAQPSGTTKDLYGISCSTPASCVAVGTQGAITTTNGGLSWTAQTVAGTSTSFVSVDCPTAATCYAAGSGGTVAKSNTSGITWTAGNTGQTNSLSGISCPSPTHCVAVGDAGRIVETLDAGTTWNTLSSGTTANLRAVSCATDADCWAVSQSGTVTSNIPVAGVPDTGTCDHGKVGAPPACVDTKPPIFVPSDDCNISPHAVVVDGYVGSLYARLRTKQAGSETWVCARLQPEGGTEYAGGKFVAGGAVNPALPDANGGACAQQPGYTHYTGGFLAGDPYSFDSWVDSDNAWVCLTAAGLGARVRLSSGDGTLPFQQDNPTAATSPLRTAWTPGVASAECYTQAGGTKTWLADAVFGGVQVWAMAWQSGSRTELCVRAEQGSTSAGGRFTIDANPGVTPVATIGSDTTGCDTAKPLFSNDTASMSVTVSDKSANPASVCITRGSSTIRLTAGYTGTADPVRAVKFDKD